MSKLLREECKCYEKESYEEILFITLERVRRVRTNMFLLFRLIPCPDDCEDLSEVLCLIQKELTKILKGTEELIECFDPMCFACSPNNVFANLLETDCLTEGSLGLISYLNYVHTCEKDKICEELALLRVSTELMDLTYRFLQNAEREYICEEEYC